MSRSLLGTALALALTVSCSQAVEHKSDVIPSPADVRLSDKSVDINKFNTVSCPALLGQEADFLATGLRQRGVETDIADNAGNKAGAIILAVDSLNLGEESYSMTVSRNRVRITGGDAAGVFYGIQTLLQQVDAGGLYTGTVNDSPRYSWRGYMLDESRHFAGKEKVKQILDIMAYYKLNRFHWHLTDAPGWRIEIKGWPLLTVVGGRGNYSDPGAPVRYYTQEEISEIVSYASSLHIEVIPEIDMPGHASAANRAYPQFNGGGTPQFKDFTFNVGKEETYSYLTSILREVASLFHSEYIHIGGDEVSFGSSAWLADSYVKSMMQREGLSTIKEAEGYFIHRMTDSLKVMGKKVLGWDDMLDFPLDNSVNCITWWRHDRPHSLKKALDGGFATVMCPRKPLYFDFVQNDSHNVGRKWDGCCPLEDVYAFPDPWFKEWEITAEEERYIMGMQANLWSELVHNEDRLDFLTFPRICALAEAAWTPAEKKDYGDFTRRMENAYRLFDSLGLYYYDDRNPEHHPEPAGPVIK